MSLRATGRSTETQEPTAAPNNLAERLAAVQDFEVAVRVSQLNPPELDKIGKDFGATYRIRNLTLLYKNPDKLRLEGQSAVYGDALLILNGAKRFYAVPKLKIRKSEDLTASPAKRQSLLEYGGLLSKDTLSFMKGKFLKQEELDGKRVEVYDLSYQGQNAGSSYRVWIDPETRITRKRDWFDGEKNLKATFRYTQPREAAPGVWLPGQCEIRNAEGNLGAVLTYKEAKINQNLPDRLFEISP